MMKSEKWKYKQQADVSQNTTHFHETQLHLKAANEFRLLCGSNVFLDVTQNRSTVHLVRSMEDKVAQWKCQFIFYLLDQWQNTSCFYVSIRIYPFILHTHSHMIKVLTKDCLFVSDYKQRQQKQRFFNSQESPDRPVTHQPPGGGTCSQRACVCVRACVRAQVDTKKYGGPEDQNTTF